ncbi:MAG: GYF domain-containing protein [Bdellovibrionaceae bacterium]|nr:GYF domain-containing protein [Pseudobdellovibrionaceae bacterium]MDW8189727.1 GYF domain-containing protein [Pseudobdellovibrionaceae bacterium]
MESFHVTCQGKPTGPLLYEEIVTKIKNGQIQLNDYIYNPEKNDWEIILLSPLIDDQYKMLPIERDKEDPVVLEATNFWENRDWYIFKNNKQQGPYSYFDLLNMLQAQRLHDYDFVWTKGLVTWAKIYEVPVFSENHIRRLSASTDPKLQNVFFRRQFPRISVKQDVYFHNNKRVWRAELVELSAGGCGLVFDGEGVDVSDRVILHLPEFDSKTLPSFNVLGVVVSRKRHQNGFKLGLRFEALNQDIQLRLKLLTEQKAS